MSPALIIIVVAIIFILALIAGRMKEANNISKENAKMQLQHYRLIVEELQQANEHLHLIRQGENEKDEHH